MEHLLELQIAVESVPKQIQQAEHVRASANALLAMIGANLNAGLVHQQDQTTSHGKAINAIRLVGAVRHCH